MSGFRRLEDTLEEATDGHEEPGVRVLNVKMLVAMIYFGVCGGITGSEGMLSGFPPPTSLVIILVLPFLVGLPVLFVVAELSIAMPEAGGFVHWAKKAFGKRVGFVCGIMNYVAMFLDTALYPALFLEYLVSAFPGATATVEKSYVAGVLIKAAFAMLLNVLVLSGVQPAGKGAWVISILVLLPLVLLVVWGMFSPHMKWSNVVMGHQFHGNEAEDSNGRMLNYFNVLYWSFSAFDQASTVAGDISSPQKTFPRASTVSVLLISCTYLFPLVIAAGIIDDWRTVKAGSIQTVARIVGGEFLSGIVFLSSLFSCLGMYLTALLEVIFVWLGMAELNMVHPVFRGRHPRTNVPYSSAIFTMTAIMLVSFFDFGGVLSLTNMFSAFCVLMTLASAIAIRIYEPNFPRPFKTPLYDYGIVAYIALLCPVILMNVVFLCMSMFYEKWMALAFLCILIAVYAMSHDKILLFCCRVKPQVVMKRDLHYDASVVESDDQYQPTF